MASSDPFILGDENTVISTVADLTVQQFFDQNPTVTISDVGAIASAVVVASPEFFSNAVPIILGDENTLISTVADVTLASFFASPRTQNLVDVTSIDPTTTVAEPTKIQFIIGGANKDVGGIASTAAVSEDTGFQGGIFRALIYRDGEISQIGNTEAMFVAGGVRVEPASRTTLSADSGANSQITVPTNPVGFLTITINGVNYKVPYFA